jgi:hypothetical protein
MPAKATGTQPIALIFSNEIKDLEAILPVKTGRNPF